MFCLSNRKVAKTAVGAREWAAVVIGLTMLDFWRNVEDFGNLDQESS